jgi:hypothetical protein
MPVVGDHFPIECIIHDSTYCLVRDSNDCVIRQRYTPAMPVAGEYQSRNEECADYSPKEWNTVCHEYNQRQDDECANYTSNE